jgi:hypothetical protein
LELRSYATPHEEALRRRIRETAALFGRRRYAPPVDVFSHCLVGGAESPERVQVALESMPDFSLREGFVVARGAEVDLKHCQERRASHVLHREKMLAEAVEFTRDLVRTLPAVRAVCLTGSLASGGFLPADDIDFNLFVDDNAKYATYLTSFLLSLKYSLRHRGKPELDEGKTPLLPKVICINVIFRDRDCVPFTRRDRYLGFELLLQEPLFGVEYYREVVGKNEWLMKLFPQLHERLGKTPNLVEPARTPLHAVWRADKLGLLEPASRLLTRGVFEAVQFSRRKNPAAQHHVARVRQFQYPYGVFQD